jgi:hypothetical protein
MSSCSERAVAIVDIPFTPDFRRISLVLHQRWGHMI